MSTSEELASTSSLPSQPLLPARWSSDDLISFEAPAIDFEPSRWATARTKNVEDVAKYWKENPALAYVFKDSKLRGNELVMLRKDLIDQIVTPLIELSRGRAAIRVDIDIVGASIKSLKHSLKCLISGLDSSIETATEAAQAALATADAIEVQIHRISGSVVVSSPKDTESASLTEDEEALAKELLAEEESNDD